MHAGLDHFDFQAKLFAHYGPGTDYARTSSEDARKHRPVDGPWANGVIKNFLKKYEAKEAATGDPTNNDMDALICAIPVMVLYAGKADLLEQVEKTVRTLQVSVCDKYVCRCVCADHSSCGVL